MARPKTLRPDSFSLRPDAAQVAESVRILIEEGHNGPTIMAMVGITRNVLGSIVKRNGWSIGRNLNRSQENGNVRKAKMTPLCCPYCGVETNWPQSILRGRTTKYCNDVCYAKSRKV